MAHAGSYPLMIAALAASVVAGPTIIVQVDPQQVLNTVPADFLSATIDTASIYSGFDFTNPVLINLVKQMAPATIRIGGTASDNSLYLPYGPNGVGPNGAVSINNQIWNNIAYFQQRTGVDILWDLCRQTDSNGAYDPTINATALFNYTQSMGFTVAAWEVGNELTSVSPSQYIADLQALKKALSGYKVGQFISGPSTCCNPMSWVTEFMQAGAAVGLPDLFSMHSYPLSQCTLAEFVSHDAVNAIVGTLSAFKSARDAAFPGLKLNLEETATKSGGGCDGLSNRYASGFYYMHTIGIAAEHGFYRVNRQDVAGWSFVGRPSHYPLAGQPGWTNGSIAPHPDWYTHVLTKQLMGANILNATRTGDSSLVDSFSVHAWCAPASAGPAGSVTLSYINFNDSDVAISLSGMTLVPRVEYVLTADPSQYENRGSVENLRDPPAFLTNDTIYNNGILLNVTEDGMLPMYPIPGKSVVDPSAPLQVPAYSYGFFVFQGANWPACQ